MTAHLAFGRLHVVPALCEFLQNHPEVNVRYSLGDRNINLVDEHVDLALRVGVLPSSGMVAKSLGEVRRVVCASPHYLARHAGPQHPDALAEHPCIGFDVLDAGYGWRFVVDGKDHMVPIRARLVVNSAEAAVDAAATGFGLASVLSYQAEAALRRGDLSLVLRDYEAPPLPVNFLYLGQGRLPLKVRAWLDFAGPRLRERIAAVDEALNTR